VYNPQSTSMTEHLFCGKQVHVFILRRYLSRLYGPANDRLPLGAASFHRYIGPVLRDIMTLSQLSMRRVALTTKPAAHTWPSDNIQLAILASTPSLAHPSCLPGTSFTKCFISVLLPMPSSRL